MQQNAVSSGEVMIKEIPIPLVRANQIMFVIGTILAIVLVNKWIILFLFAVTISSLLFGPRANLAFRITRPILSYRLFYARTESVELQRFNQIIATTCLFLSTFFLFSTEFYLVGWVWAGMVTAAASAAIMGYCVGCLIYFPYKRKVAGLRKKNPGINFLFDFIAGTGVFRPPLQEKYQPLMIMGYAHEAVRNGLQTIMEKVKVVNMETLPGLLEDINKMTRFIEHHALQEDLKMYPPIDAKSKGITQKFEDEHQDIMRLQVGMENAITAAQYDHSKLPAAAKIILEWAEYNWNHLRSEEKVLMPKLPHILTYDEARDVVRGILEINPGEYEDFHLVFAFRNLKPGQRYAYIHILMDSCTPDEFSVYEKILKPMVPADSWNDFTTRGKMIA